MNCQEAREWFSALLDGEIGLTEGVLVEAHASQCAECHQALLDLQESRLPRSTAWRRASIIPMVEPPEPSPLPPAEVAEASPHRLIPVTVFRLSAIAISLMVVTALGLHFAWRSPEPEVEIPHAAAPVTPADEPPSVAPAPTQTAPAVAPPRSEPKAPTAPPAMPSVKERAPVRVELPPRPERPSVIANAGRAKADRPGPTAATPSLPPTERPAPAKPTEEKAAPKPSVAATPPPEREPAPETTVPPEEGTVDVVMQLAARERSTAMRDMRALLARLGGTAHGRDQGTILVIVPQSQYSEFTRGLTRIGTWQLQAERSALSDPVHVTIRMVR